MMDEGRPGEATSMPEGAAEAARGSHTARPTSPEVIVALDFAERAEAIYLVERLGERVGFYKVGLELFSRAGPDVVRELREGGKRVFLDLKLFDIPDTVAGAVSAAAECGASLLTLHTAGGRPMLDTAVLAASTTGDGADRIRLLGVTVLTSLSPSDIEATWGRSILSLRDEVVRLAALAMESGLDGVVASAFETMAIRRRLGPEVLVVTPGIRLPGGEEHDQARVATPAFAVEEGSDFLVVGRAISQAEDPGEAFETVLAAMASPRSTHELG